MNVCICVCMSTTSLSVYTYVPVLICHVYMYNQRERGTGREGWGGRGTGSWREGGEETEATSTAREIPKSRTLTCPVAFRIFSAQDLVMRFRFSLKLGVKYGQGRHVGLWVCKLNCTNGRPFTPTLTKPPSDKPQTAAPIPVP